jgi:hypothetical protein
MADALLDSVVPGVGPGRVKYEKRRRKYFIADGRRSAFLSSAAVLDRVSGYFISKLFSSLLLVVLSRGRRVHQEWVLGPIVRLEPG